MRDYELYKITDTMLRGIFNMNFVGLSIYIGFKYIPDFEELCDEMGIDALKAITECELRSMLWTQTQPHNSITFTQMKNAMQVFALEIGRKYQRIAREKGIDLVTGRKLEAK